MVLCLEHISVSVHLTQCSVDFYVLGRLPMFPDIGETGLYWSNPTGPDSRLPSDHQGSCMAVCAFLLWLLWTCWWGGLLLLNWLCGCNFRCCGSLLETRVGLLHDWLHSMEECSSRPNMLVGGIGSLALIG